jgi:hypothetical protein
MQEQQRGRKLNSAGKYTAVNAVNIADKQEAGSRKQEAGSRKQEAGSFPIFALH